MLMKLTAYSHHVAVTNYTQQGAQKLLEFCRPLAQYGPVRVGRGTFIRAMVRVYAAATKDRSEFRFHIHLLDELMEHLDRVGYKDQFTVVYKQPSPGVPVKFKMGDAWESREHQVPIIDFLVDDGATKAVTLQTGKGKTYCATRAIEHLGVRTVIVIKSMYIDKWRDDVEKMLGLKPGQVMIVRGTKHLRALIDLGKADELDAQCIIVSNTTFRMFLEDYERHDGGSGLYGCKPYEFYETIGAGLRIIDEVHQDFHLNFKQDLYTHVPKTISLSATLENDDPFIERMYGVMFPDHTRYGGAVYDAYVAVTALMYSSPNVGKLRFKNKALKSYSHVLFENSLMKHKDMLQRYLDMIAEVVQAAYVQRREEGQRFLVFASTKQMCGIIAEDLQRRWPELNINRYISEDDYEVLLSSDISVSTVKSAGTAVDIPGLRGTFLTDALNSRQANEQAKGRLRKLDDRWPDLRVEFYYLVCEDIPKHIEYHQKKMEKFKGKVYSHRVQRLNHSI